MKKYYNKEIPTEISVVYGGRHYGKTYREFEKIKTRIEELEEENKRLKENQSGFTLEEYTRILNDYQELQQRINKAIDLVDKNIILDEDILKNAKKLGLDENHIKQISNDLNLYKCLKIELKGEE